MSENLPLASVVAVRLEAIESEGVSDSDTMAPATKGCSFVRSVTTPNTWASFQKKEIAYRDVLSELVDLHGLQLGGVECFG